MSLKFSRDKRLLPAYEQIMLGSSLMLCPVTHAGVRTRAVILPQGEWYDFWSDQKYSGGQTIDLMAPIDRLPLLVKGGSILPMGPLMQFTTDQHRFNELSLHFYPPYQSATILRDDDAQSRAYLDGEVAQTNISVSENKARIIITVGKSLGANDLSPKTRKIECILHDCETVQQVRIDGEQTDQWEYDPYTRQLSISVVCSSSRGMKIDLFPAQLK